MVETNVLAMRIGPGKHLHGRTLIGGVKGEEFDYFHDLIVAQELSRASARGFQDGNLSGLMISLTAVRAWLNNDALKEKVTEECLSGKKYVSSPSRWFSGNFFVRLSDCLRGIEIAISI